MNRPAPRSERAPWPGPALVFGLAVGLPAAAGAHHPGDQVAAVVDADVAFGVGSQIAGLRTVDGRLQGAAEAVGTLRMFSGGLDARLTERLWAGGGLVSTTLGDPFASGGERSVLGLEARARSSLDLSPRWGLDLTLRAGLDRWSDDGQGSLTGWHLRVGANARVALLDGLAVQAGLHQLHGGVFTRDDVLSDQPSAPQPVALASWLLVLGVRTW